MKLIHISDLHLGKRLKDKTLIEDQKHVLEQILDITKREIPDGVIIAGDVYDKAVPPAEAVLLLDDFIVDLSKICDHIFLISGNHDSAERLFFGSRIMEKSGVHLASNFDGDLKKFRLEKPGEAGSERKTEAINIWMLPFIKPIHLKPYYDDIDRDDYTGAIKRIIDEADIDTNERNILIAHQYVTGSSRSESEEVPVGGLDGVDAEVFCDFDYVALGHLHRMQGDGNIRYCGAPIKYSFAEADDEKGLLIVEIDAGSKVKPDVKFVPLSPLHEVRTVRGSFDELMRKANTLDEDERNAFMRADLTDDEYIPDGISRLRSAYPNVLGVRYPDIQRREETFDDREISDNREPIEYVEGFYEAMRGRAMSDDQRALCEEMVRRIWEES